MGEYSLLNSQWLYKSPVRGFWLNHSWALREISNFKKGHLGPIRRAGAPVGYRKEEEKWKRGKSFS
jgi:hypothetical protein